jgi:phosphatidylserine/phosphatidylglycerophosphate/cardiolipin synthase-like enzyme
VNIKTAKGNPAENHAKVVIADQKCAYIGSQNLYPAGFWKWDFVELDGQLAEFGVLIMNQYKLTELMNLLGSFVVSVSVRLDLI